MDRYFVPRLGFLVVLGLASLLIVGIVLRSPDTHGNLWGEVRPGYTRTVIATLAGEATWGTPHTRVAFALPGVLWEAAEPMNPGKRVYIEAGCATCHGVDARGGAVGTSLAGANAEIVKNVVRKGPGGMPAYSKDHLSDADLDKLAAYLQGLEASRPKPLVKRRVVVEEQKVAELQQQLAAKEKELAQLRQRLEAASPPGTEAKDTVKIRVETTDAGFNGKPGDFIIEVEQGKTVELTFVWANEVYLEDEHIMVLDGYMLEWDKINAQRREAAIKFVADKAGSFNFRCELYCEAHDALKKGQIRVKGG